MTTIAEALERQPVLVLDGGLATELEARGHELDARLWSASVLSDTPAAIRSLHADYLEAGADCLITASYQVTFQGYAAIGRSEDEATAALKRSVALAREARDGFDGRGRATPLVAASVGPYGAYLADGSEYRGDYGLTQAELEDFHRPRWRVLAASQADLLACETIPSAVEARALASLVEATPGRTAWFSFQAKDGRHLADGSDLGELVTELEAVTGIEALGVNCVAPELVGELIRTISAHTAKPVVVYPNSGEGWDAESRSWTAAGGGCDPGSAAVAWRDLGARLIGGCCRTGPATVRRLRATLLPQGPT